MQDAQLARWKRLQGVDIHAELEKILGSEARFRVIGTGVKKTLLFQLPAKSISSGTTVQAGISCVKWDPRQCYSPSQIVIITPESAVSKTFRTFLDRTAEFRPKMRQLGELVERGVQMVYLIAMLLLYTELEFMNIIRIKADNVYIFRSPISCPNIVYSVVEYTEDEFRRGDISAVCRLIKQKLKEYTAPAKIIIYSGSIVTTQEVSSALDCHVYYRDVGDAAVKDEIRKAWESADKRVVVATNTFGLGIDRPDIRVVVYIGPIY
ncbi:ATP-dependent DNA helicase Q1 [Lachnellula suecica]|uniref:ATP-dependent DNA helicase Q1 n=1 Tax=Lachnellula suecica TaxID=602035 RepID=A0A8T9BT39_9HELO|nr:ATP-dependent DNA helicase Q1 [Lachnellula suecica]